MEVEWITFHIFHLPFPFQVTNDCAGAILGDSDNVKCDTAQKFMHLIIAAFGLLLSEHLQCQGAYQPQACQDFPSQLP